MSQTNIANGRRMSTAHCYMDPIRAPGNLRIVSEASDRAPSVRRQACIGIRYSVGGESREVRARREVSSAPVPSTRRSFWSFPALVKPTG